MSGSEAECVGRADNDHDREMVVIECVRVTSSNSQIQN